MNEITSVPENEEVITTGANDTTEEEQMSRGMSDVTLDSVSEREELVLTGANNARKEEKIRRGTREIKSSLEKKQVIINGANNATEARKMKIMIAVNKLGGYPHVSPSSIDAFDWTLDTILSTDKRSHFKLSLVHVQVPKTRIQHYTSLFRSRADREEKVRQFQAYFEGICNDLEIEHQWFADTTRYPKKAICGMVESVEPHLLVLGHSRGRTFFQRLFGTDVSRYCAKKAECRVVRIKPEEVTRGYLGDALVPA